MTPPRAKLPFTRGALLPTAFIYIAGSKVPRLSPARWSRIDETVLKLILHYYVMMRAFKDDD